MSGWYSTIAEAIRALSHAYQYEGINVWLDSPNRNLDGRRPIDLLDAGEYDRVLAEARRVGGEG